MFGNSVPACYCLLIIFCIPDLTRRRRSDLLQAVVPRATSRDPEVRSQCCEAVRQLLEADVEGGVSLEAVQLVADLVKKRK